jgi:hypothetical protein
MSHPGPHQGWSGEHQNLETGKPDLVVINPNENGQSRLGVTDTVLLWFVTSKPDAIMDSILNPVCLNTFFGW